MSSIGPGAIIPPSPVSYDSSGSEGNQPRALVTIANLPPVAPTRFAIDFNAHGATDTAQIDIPISSNPDWSEQIARLNPSPTNPVYIEIDAGWWGQPLGRRFFGVADQWEAEFEQDHTIFKCRSLAAPLIDTKITTPFNTSFTTEQFISAMATRFGLGLNVAIANTPGNMTDVLAHEFIAGVHNWIIWELMLQAAQYDDVDLWVDKNVVVNYQAASLVERTSVPFIYGKHEIEKISGNHAVQFSKYIKVEVRSYVKKTKTAYVSRVTTNPNGGITQTTSTKSVTSSPVFGTTESLSISHASNGSTTVTLSNTSGGSASSTTGFASESGVETYIYYVKNKTPAQCDVIAQQLWRQISMHENSILMTCPMTTRLLPVVDITNLLQLSGMPYASLNGQYWPRKITETLDPKSGWKLVFNAVNVQPPMGAV